jgi:WD40 repeat protein
MRIRSIRGIIALLASVLILTGLLYACNSPLGGSGQKEALLWRLHGHKWWVEKVTWSPDGKYIAACSSDNSVQVWEAATGNRVTELTNFQGGVYNLAWSPDGNYLATDSSGPMSVEKIWDVKTWNVIHILELPVNVLGRGISWSPDSQTLAIVGSEGVLLWDITAERIAGRLDLVAGALSPAWSPDGKSIAFATAEDSHSSEGYIAIWHPYTGVGSQNVTDIQALPGDAGLPHRIAWSPDSQRLASSGNNTIPVWDVASGKNIASLKGHSMEVKSVDWSPDGKSIASGSSDGTTRIWNVADGSNMAIYKHGDMVLDVEWSPDGQFLASASGDHDVYLWRVTADNSAPSPTRP